MPTFLSSTSSSRPQSPSPTKPQQWLNNVSPLPRPSLSESALPSRRILLRSNNSNLSTASTTSTVGIRPSRFVKPTSSSSNPLLPAAAATSNDKHDMQSFVNMYEDYSQKVYMEGYLMHQDKKYFVELCGTTLALWDIERPGEVVTPDYIPIMVDTRAYPTLRQQFTLELSHKKKNMVFDTLDPASLTKWICALRLACFERQLLNRFFTLRLFSLAETTTNITVTASNSSGYLQVLLPNNKNEWKKLWVVVTDNSNNNSNHDTIGKKSKILQKQPSDPTASCPQLTLLDSKKSKAPLLTLKRVDHAYAVYPESASLVYQSTLIRLEGVQQDDQPISILLMADSSNHLTQWLSSLYNAFKLYGRPHSLVQDPMNPVALNFGELLPDNAENGPGNWWLDTQDVIQDMDIFTSMNNQEVYQLLVTILQQKQSSTLQQQVSSSSVTNTAYSHHHHPQQRANSLPLITVESIDCPRQRSTSDAGILNEPSIRSALHSQVADSSDESDDNSDGDEDDFEDEADSDDEPIGKSKPTALHKSSTKKAFSSLLIPDFDFGNGFDTDRSGSACSSSVLSGGPSPTSSVRLSSSRRPSMQRRQLSSSSTTISSGNSDTATSKKPSPAPPASSLFGDFSLPTDFNKYLDPSTSTPSRLSTPDRKYSLPANVKLYNSSGRSSPAMSSSSFNERHSSSWYDYGNGWDDRSPRARYMDEDYIYQEGDDGDDDEDGKTGYDDESEEDDYEQDGPLIPSLNDHFAPRNSLLDTHAGEQLSAREQIEYARATGQPLIQMPSKPRPPKGGLVGVISQREKSRRQGNGMRVAERVNQHHVDRFEREKERRIMEQRQQQYMKHQIMMYAANGYVHPMMMHPYMAQPGMGPPPLPSPAATSSTPMIPPSPPYPGSSPLTPTHSASPSTGYSYGRPYSPSGNSYFGLGGNTAMYPTSLSPQPFISTNNNNMERRNSRPLLSEEEEEEEPLFSPYMAYYNPQLQQPEQQLYPRNISPPFYQNMNPVPSASTGSSSVHL